MRRDDPNLADTLPATDRATRPAPPGRERIGRYLVERRIGAGGMGQVYQASDPELGRKVAIKLLHGAGSGSGPASARLLREAQAMAKLSHPNVITVHDVGKIDDEVFLAMELVDGVTLSDWCGERDRSWSDVIGAFAQAGEGLAAAHAAGLVHRDFKPENVLVGRDGRVRVLDFGLARLASSHEPEPAARESDPGNARLTKTGAVMGTPLYMAPEQHAGESVDARADQFAFCVALWEALFGAHPFGGESIPEVAARVREGVVSDPPAAHAVPLEIVAALRRGLRVDPAERHPSMRALLDALRPGPPRKRRGWIAAAVAAAAGAAAIAIAARPGGEAADPRVAPAAAPTVRPPEPVRRKLTSTGSVASLALSRDGRFVAYFDGARLVVRDLGDGTERAPFGDAPYLPLHWSGDGTSLIVKHAANGRLLEVPAAGGEAIELNVPPAFAYAWSGDHAEIAALRAVNQKTVSIHDRSGRTVREIALAITDPFIERIDRFDERFVVSAAAGTGGSSLWIVEADGLARRLVEERSRILDAEWGAGNLVYYLRTVEGGADLVRIAADPAGDPRNGEPEVVASGLGAAVAFDISADRRRVAYVSGRRNADLSFVELHPSTRAWGAPRPLTAGSDVERGASFSPDGDRIAYESGNGVTQEIFVTDGTDARQLTSLRANSSGPAWSADGSRIAFTSDRGGKRRVWIVDAAGGEARPIEGTEASESSPPAWIGNARIVYQRVGNRTFHVVDPETGEDRRLLDEPGWMFWPSVSPDGRWLAFYTNRGQRVSELSLLPLSPESGASRTIANGRHVPLGWSLDGRVVFALTEAEGADAITALRIDDGREIERVEPKLPEGFIVTARSRDGLQFVVSREETESDAWIVDGLPP